MIIVLLVFAVITYLLILCALTLWFNMYHYVKDKYFIKTSIEDDHLQLSGLKKGTGSGNSKNSHR